MCFNSGNNCSCLWLIIIVILILCCCGGSWGGCSNGCGCGNNSCGNNGCNECC